MLYRQHQRKYLRAGYERALFLSDVIVRVLCVCVRFVILQGYLFSSTSQSQLRFGLILYVQWEAQACFFVLVVGLLVYLLHSAPDGHLGHLEGGPVQLLDQAEHSGQDVRVLQGKTWR